MAAEGPVLEVDRLTVAYPRRRQASLTAVDEVSFTIGEGETIGLVGESGSGKSTIGKAILGLVEPSAGSIRFDGQDITNASRGERRQLSRHVQVVFQDPFSSLNPAKNIRRTLLEPFLAHRHDPAVAALDPDKRVREVLEHVGLPSTVCDRYPGEFSGGQRQRIAIARALMLQPKLVICDEAVSALDVSVQAHVVNLLADLQAETGVSYLFISHDLAVVRHLSHRIVVLRRGQVVEAGTAGQVYLRPQHPYTQALLAAAPLPDPAVQRGRSVQFAAGPAAAADLPPAQ
jgi:peptide/nickel transport system ATP-binding protein